MPEDLGAFYVQDNVPDYGLPWGSSPGFPTGAFRSTPSIDQSNFYGLRDYEKIFCADRKSGDIFAMRGIDRERGCMVIVRPDQFVAHVLPLDGHAQLAAFFDGFMTAH